MTGAYQYCCYVSPCMECWCDVSYLRTSVDRKERIGRKYKRITMAQWDNHHQNRSLVNQMQ